MKPDIINIWGTEYLHCHIFYEISLSLKIPCVFFIQGLLGEIAHYSGADLSIKERIKNVTLRDIYRRQLLINEKKRFEKIAKYEAGILENPINYIYENDWCKSRCVYANPNSRGFLIHLPFENVFARKKKSFENFKSDNPILVCNASGYPLKGLHVVLKALYQLKNKFPTIKLMVPGVNVFCPTTILKRQKYPGYYVYISRLIKQLNLLDNVVFTGYLSPDELSNLVLSSDIFVLSSAIENHASSLKEAMALGMPCVASYVGGVDSYCQDKANVLYYRFGDYKMLAYKIDFLLSNKAQMADLGAKARSSIIDNESNAVDTIYSKFIDCYKKVVFDGQVPGGCSCKN